MITKSEIDFPVAVALVCKHYNLDVSNVTELLSNMLCLKNEEIEKIGVAITAMQLSEDISKQQTLEK